MKVRTQETLYEDLGATLKHKCGKRIVTLPLLSFIFFYYFGTSLFFWPLFLLFFVRSLIPTCGGIRVSISFPHWDNALIMIIITLHFYLQLKNYNSILRTKYDSIWMPPAVYRDVQWIMSDMYERIMKGGFATNTMSTTWSCKAIWQWWSVS